MPIGFGLFVEGFDLVSSDPIPKVFKLSSSEEAFACIDFETTLIEAAQHFVDVCRRLIEISCRDNQGIVNVGSSKS